MAHSDLSQCRLEHLEGTSTLERLAVQLNRQLALGLPAFRTSPNENVLSSVTGAPTNHFMMEGISRSGGEQPSSPLALQMLSEPLPWNWPTPSLGTTPFQAYNFFDRIPVSGIQGQTYGASSNSFSRNYGLFLKLLDPDKYLDRAALFSALKANPPPFFGPDSNLPTGWTRVTDVTGTQVAQPGWSIPLYPSEWITGVSKVAMTLDLSGYDTLITSGVQNIAIDGPAVPKLGFSAKAWGAIPISPATWFDSSIVSYVELTGGPYKNSNWDNSKIFGQDGLIPRRVVQFIVALDPSINVEIHNTAFNCRTPIDAIQVAAFRFSSAPQVPESILASIVAETASDSTQRIVAQAIGPPQAFIIAAQIESISRNQNQ